MNVAGPRDSSESRLSYSKLFSPSAAPKVGFITENFHVDDDWLFSKIDGLQPCRSTPL